MIHDFPPRPDTPGTGIKTHQELAAYLWSNDNIVTLHLEDYQEAYLPRLPESLRELVVSNCPNLKLLPNAIPQWVHTVKISKCPILSSLPGMPHELKVLVLSELPNVEIFTRVPRGLTMLHIEKCGRLYWIESFGGSLIKLWLTGCPQLKRIPPFADVLNDVAIFECSIAQLPELPEGLRSIRLHGCTKLDAKFRLSRDVAFVHITDCPFVVRC